MHYKGLPNYLDSWGGQKGGPWGDPPFLSPAACLFCPVDDEGTPTSASRNSANPAVGGGRAGVMSLGCQHKVRLKSKVLGHFSLGAMGCAAPSEVLGFAACRLWHISQIFTHSRGRTSILYLLPQSSFFPLPISHYIDFSPSLAPFNLVLEVQTLNIYSLNVADCSQ